MWTSRLKLAFAATSIAVLSLVIGAACDGAESLPTATPRPTVVASPTVSPTTEPSVIVAPPDTIVARLSDFNSEIYTIAQDGAHLTRVTDTPGHVEHSPVWSPDGRLAFIRYPLFAGHQGEVVVTEPDGTDLVPVAEGMNILYPSWSPDGDSIAFLEDVGFVVYQGPLECPQSRIPRLFLADVALATSSSLLELAAPDGCPIASEPRWSPDGTRIALATRGVYVVDVARGRLEEIVPPTDAVAAAWSPDGQHLAVATASSTTGIPSARVLIVGADGQGLTEIVGLGDTAITSLAWSPQGDLIAVTGGAPPQNQLYLVDPDGSGLRPLAQGVERGLAWSPDGRHLAVSLKDPSSDIYTVDVDDGSTTRLTDVSASDYGPVWSPDGSAIAFVSRRDAQSGIFAVHPDGSLTPLVPSHGEPAEAFLGPGRRLVVPVPASVEGNPLAQGTLSPDGRRLANSVSTADMLSEGCSGDVQDVYTHNVDGSETANVTNTPDINEIGLVWSPDSLLLALTSGAPPRCHFVPGRLEVIRADGSERRLLADFGDSRGRVELPEWVSGGKALLFSVTHLGPGPLPGPPAPDEKAEIYTVNIDGSGLRPLLEFPDASIDWLLSPDRTRLAVVEAQTAGDWRLLLVNTDGTDLQEVASDEGQLALDGQPPLGWSPDGSRLAFIGCEGDPCQPVVFVVNRDGSGLREVARGQGEFSRFQWWPNSWSPDGTRLIFADCQGDPCQWALFVVNADGSDPRRLADPFSLWDPPLWSPDSSRLALITHPEPCVPGEGVPPGHLEVVRVDTAERQRLTDRCIVREILEWVP